MLNCQVWYHEYSLSGLNPSVKRGISVRMLWRQKITKKHRCTYRVHRGFFGFPFGPNDSYRKPRLTDGFRSESKVVAELEYTRLHPFFLPLQSLVLVLHQGASLQRLRLQRPLSRIHGEQ